jgi:hypothetical protein
VALLGNAECDARIVINGEQVRILKTEVVLMTLARHSPEDNEETTKTVSKNRSLSGLYSNQVPPEYNLKTLPLHSTRS